MTRSLKRLSKSVNDFWRMYGYHHGQVRLRNHPAVFAIESTNHCNLRCVMCPRGEPDIMERSLGTMSDGLSQKILDDAKFFTDPCWFHWFGEPLMHPRLFEQIAQRAGACRIWEFRPMARCSMPRGPVPFSIPRSTHS
jgi:sulfatase maturation enzyme AslB (radical SAM superfamily)